MANLITYTAFTGEINIPCSAIDTQTLLTEYITDYQEEILIDLLGYPLYKLFIAGLEEQNPAQKWLDLRDGAEFSFDFNGKTVTCKFAGVSKIVAYYIYLKFRNENESFFSGQNQVKSDSENSIPADFTEVIVPKFNKMVQLYGRIPRCYYMPFSPDANTSHFDSFPSAFNFLLANISDYPDWLFTPIAYANEYGI